MQSLISVLESSAGKMTESAYEFHTKQDKNSITLSFHFNKFKSKKPIVIINKEQSSICIIYNGAIMLCGTLFSSFTDYKSQIFNGSNYSITFYKQTKGKWPYLIGSESSRGLDAFSFITIGNYIEKNFFDFSRFEKSLSYIKEHYKPEYITVLKNKGFELLNSKFPPKVKHGINIIRLLPLNSLTDYDIKKLTKVLFRIKDFALASRILENCVSTRNSMVIYLQYVKLVSPYEYNQISPAVIPMYKYALDELVKNNNIKAMYYLSKHYHDGLYYEKDEKLANQFKKIVKDSKYAKYKIQIRIASVVIPLIGVGIAGFAFYKMFNSKK